MLTRWAFMTIKLSCAWRKISVSRTVGSISLRSISPKGKPVPTGEARPNRGQLIRVAHENEPFSTGDRPQKIVQQQNIHHAHFVHDHCVTFQGIVFIPQENHFPGGRVDGAFQQTVNGGGILAGDLGEPFGSPAGGRSQNAGQLHLAQ